MVLSSLEQAAKVADAMSRAAKVLMLVIIFFIVESSLFPIFFLRSTIATAIGLNTAASQQMRLMLQLDDFHRRSLIVFSYHCLLN